MDDDVRPIGDVRPTVEDQQERTGDEVVDAALADLAGLAADVPLEDHVRVLDEVHQALQQRLAATQG